LIMGVANDHSIAWGIAKALAAQGAELAFTYQGEALGKRVKPLAESLGVPVVLPCTLLGVNLYRSLSDINFRRIAFMLLGTSGCGLLAKAAASVSLLALIARAATR